MVIRASAGAGKTFALSNRYLKLLRHGADPATILATTFTRKAAGEILGRVLTRLTEAALSEANAAKLAEELRDPSLELATVRVMLGRVCRSMHRVSVSTIDSFFHRMVGCYRFELGLPRSPRLVEAGSPIARQVRLDAIAEMLADDDPHVLIDLLRRLHHDQAKRRITDAIDDIVTDLYDIYRQTERRAWRAIPAPEGSLDRVALAAAIETLRESDDLVASQKSWAKAWSGDVTRAMARDWPAFVSAGLARCVAEGRETFGNTKKPLPASLCDVYRPLVEHARAELLAQIVRQTEATGDLLERFDAHYTRLRREQRILLYDDLPWNLSKALPAFGDPDSPGMDELYFRLDASVRHLLLDEFQDTSPTQWSILRPFGEEIVSGDSEAVPAEDDWEGEAPAEPRIHLGLRLGGSLALPNDRSPHPNPLSEGAGIIPRSFFCVGDVKQAIYGWRGGCAAVFDSVMTDLHLPPEAEHTLSKSWRSSQVVLDAVNRVFTGIEQSPPLAEISESVAIWAGGFKEHAAHHREYPGYVELVASPMVDVDESTAERDDEDGSSDTDGPHLHFVADRVAELADAHPSRTIGVLVSRNKTAATLLRLLRDRGVHASGEGGRPATDDPAVLALLSALLLADHPAHSAAAFAVSHTPLADLLGFNQGINPVVAGRAIRRALIDRGYAAVLTDWARHLAPHCNRRGVERMMQVIAVAEAYEPASSLRPRDFVEVVARTPVTDRAAAPVRVMTTHKAKGLEFDLAVLAELSPLIGRVSGTALWSLRRRETEPPLAVFRSVKAAALSALPEEVAEPIVQARDQERARRVTDDLSALYVAMTRARYALHLIVEPLRRTKSGLSSRGLNNCCPASVLRHAMADIDEPVMDGVLYTDGDSDWDALLPVREGESLVSSISGERERTQAPRFGDATNRRSWVSVSPSRLATGGMAHVDDLLGLSSTVGRQRGRVVHDAFERVTYIDEVDRDLLPGEVVAMLDHPVVREALTRRHSEETLWREHSFAARVDGRMLTGRFDRVVIETDDAGRPIRARLIDFKTDRYSDEVVEHYRPQMEAYRRALAALLHLDEADIEATLLFVADGIAAVV